MSGPNTRMALWLARPASDRNTVSYLRKEKLLGCFLFKFDNACLLVQNEECELVIKFTDG